ncbi:MAG: hypothetical protein EDS66_15035 [Planctomycetota bacterium]|nr:MAG: hypothetical protein EDS66_15035 [Planctomycetota bacterium]
MRFPTWNAFHARKRNIRLHRSEPSADFVIATGAQCSVRQFLHRFGFGIGRMDERAGRRNAADWIDSFAMRIVTRYNLRSPP